jgi:hypothetical protein
MDAAEMPATMAAAAKMRAAMAAAAKMRAAMTTAVATPVTATFRSGIPSGRQHGREDNDGNFDIEF